MKNLMRKQIDEKLKRFSAVSHSPPPKKGWLNAIREALIMTAEQAAVRVNTKRQVWLKAEAGEAKGTSERYPCAGVIVGILSQS